jgi:hypothetical protein
MVGFEAMLRWLRFALALPFSLPLALVLVFGACGGKGASSGGSSREDLDGDPLALLPASPVFAGNVDARSLYADATVSAQLAALTDKLVPLGDDAGFQPSRDVDRVVFAGYASTVAPGDVAAIVRGRFDPAKIAAATKAKNGAPIVRGAYANQTTYAVAGVTYAVLTPKTVVAGTGDGPRRVLDRIKAGSFERALQPWVVDTLQTTGAEVAVAADFATQPIASAAIGSLKLPWLQGMRTARVIGNFQAPGMNVAATLSYGVPQQAEAAADGVRFVDGWLKLLGPLLGGVRLQNLQVGTDQSDMRCKFAVDGQTLGSLLVLAPRLLPAPAPGP